MVSHQQTLICLFIANCFMVCCRYKTNSERGPLNQVMIHILPLILDRCRLLVSDQSEASVTVQKQVSPFLYPQSYLSTTHVGNLHLSATPSPGRDHRGLGVGNARQQPSEAVTTNIVNRLASGL